jgi:mutual gliding-motility protein MglA
MPVVNPLARELVFKIVYYGPGLGGKTTTLQHIHATTKPEHRGKMVSLATPVDRTLYFDFLPIRVPNVRGMGVRLQLFTVPGQVYYNATRKLVLTGADGVVIVFDSQRLRSDANLESLENLCDNLREHGRALADLPHVVQFNKRDLVDTVPIHELEAKLNRHKGPAFSTVATRGDGVFESLEAITRGVLEDFDRRMPEMRGIAIKGLALPEGGLAEALRRAEGSPPPSSTKTAGPRSGEQRTPSGAFLLSQLPEADPGEDAARAVTSSGTGVAGNRDEERTLVPPSAKPVDRGTTAEQGHRATTLQSAYVPELAAQLEGNSKPSQPPETGGSVRSKSSPSALAPRLAALDGSAALMETPTPTKAVPGTQPPPPSQLAAPPRVSAAGSVRSFSFEALWPVPERPSVVELESALAAGDPARAVALAEQLAARALASAAGVLGSTASAPRDPAVVALLLGVDGRRYLEFRALARDARAGREISQIEALAAYAMAIDLRLARSKVGT